MEKNQRNIVLICLCLRKKKKVTETEKQNLCDPPINSQTEKGKWGMIKECV